MSDTSTSLTYKLFGHDVSAGRTMDDLGSKSKKTGQEIEGHAGKLAKVGSAAGSALGLAFGGLAVGGVAALGGALVQGVKDAQDYQTLANQTAAVLKTTGNVAGTSVAHVQDLAGSLETLSGTDETLIINGENVLATFTGIHNATGKNNDIFDQATKASLNLSVAMGQDMKSSAVQVGKALNDPVKGISALSRVGVSFTAQQKEQIKALVKSGDTMGAQKIILGELNKEFGSASKAAGQGFAGSLARLQDTASDAFRSLGLLLLPVLIQVANATQAAMAWGLQHETVLKVLGAVVGTFAVALGAVKVATMAWNGVMTIANAATKAWAIGQAALNLVMSLNPIGLVVIAIIALIAIFVLAYQHVGWFRAGVQTAFRAIVAAGNWIVGAFGAIKDKAGSVIHWIVDKWNGIISFFRGVPGKISSIGASMWNGLRDGFKTVVNWIIGAWNSLHFGIPSINLGPLGSIGGFDVGVPQIPYLARGGIVTRPTVAMIGEAGPEAVIPLDRAGGVGGGNHFHFTFSGPFTGNQQDFVRAVQKAMKTTRALGVS